MDSQTSAPIDGAALKLERESTEGGVVQSIRVTSDAEGRFDFGEDSEGGVRIVANAEGYRPITERLTQPFEDSLIRLERFAGRLEGHVFADGSPLAGARILATGDGLFVEQETLSQRNGSYALNSLPDGGAAYFSVYAIAPGRETLREDLPPGESGATRTLDFDMQSAQMPGWITVTDQDERPIGGASVRFASPYVPRLPRKWVEIARTGPDGRAKLEGLPMRPGAVSVLAAGYLDGFAPFSAPINSGGLGIQLRVKLYPGCSVTGRLVDSGGSPVQGRVLFLRAGWRGEKWLHVEENPGIRVVDGRHTAWSKPDGQFEIKTLIPGTPYGLLLDAPGHASTAHEAQISVALGEKRDLGTLQIKRGRSIAGIVLVDPAQALSSVRLWSYFRPPSKGGPIRARVPVDEDGRFNLKAMPPQEIYFMGRVGDIERHFTVAPGEDTVEVDLREDFVPSSSVDSWKITVNCLDLAGAPVDGLKLLARTYGAYGFGSEKSLKATGNPGQYELGGLIASRDTAGTVSLDPEGSHVSLGRDYPLKPDNPSMSMLVARAATLRGNVVESGTGKPIQNAELVWRVPGVDPLAKGSAVELRTYTDAGGEFHLAVGTNLASQLSVTATGFMEHTRALAPLQTGSPKQEIVLTRAGRIVVEVRGETGEFMANVLLRCIPLGANDEPLQYKAATSHQTDTQGRAIFDLKSNVPYRVQLLWGSAFDEREVELSSVGEALVEFLNVQAAGDGVVIVRDASGSPVGSQAVSAYGKYQAFFSRTNLDGVARFEGLPPGMYGLRIPPQSAGSDMVTGLMQIKSGPHPTEVVIQLD